MAGNLYGRADEQAQVILPPRMGKNLWRPISPTGEIIPVPPQWDGRWVTLIAMGGDAYFFTHTSGNQSIELIASTLVNGVLTLNNKTPIPLPQGAYVPFYFNGTVDKFIYVIGQNGGTFHGAPSSPDAAGQ